MLLSIEKQYARRDSDMKSRTLPALLQLPRPLLEYQIIIAIVKGDVGAINILKDALMIFKDLCINRILLALGPTTPLSLRLPQGSTVLWATFTDGLHLQNGTHLTVVAPDQLTDLSLNLDKLSKTRTGRIPLLLGDFLDNVLPVSTGSAGLYAFLCKLFTRIRTNDQTAFFIATEDMHDPRKIAVLRRFADVVIEYRSVQEDANHAVEARILDHSQNHYGIWGICENQDADYERPTVLAT